MLKNICMVSLFVFCTALPAFAGCDFCHGVRNECWYDKKYNKHWGYWYCGKQDPSCDKKKSKGHDTVFWQYHGDYFTYKGQKYWCCNGTAEAEGKYVQSASWVQKSRTEKQPLTNGTCNKIINTTVCGTEETIDCDAPDNCSSGLILRNGECITPCGEDEVFDSPTSNTCVACPTTAYQGIQLVPNGDAKCIKCDKDSQFYDRANKKCIEKSTMTAISPTSLKTCWRCPIEEIKNCATYVEKNKNSTNMPTATKTKCKLD